MTILCTLLTNEFTREKQIFKNLSNSNQENSQILRSLLQSLQSLQKWRENPYIHQNLKLSTFLDFFINVVIFFIIYLQNSYSYLEIYLSSFQNSNHPPNNHPDLDKLKTELLRKDSGCGIGEPEQEEKVADERLQESNEADEWMEPE